jgi:hypothetical protein
VDAAAARQDRARGGRGALLVALGVTLLLVNTVRLHRSADATRRSDAYLVAAINLERLVVDAETGLRGYVITGRRSFLAPRQEAEEGCGNCSVSAVTCAMIREPAPVHRAGTLCCRTF